MMATMIQDEVVVAANNVAAERGSSDEQRSFIKSLSFSSSEDGGDDKIIKEASIVPIELLQQLKEQVTTAAPLHELFRGSSYISASENTTLMSNVRRASFREKAVKSPPSLIGDTADEHVDVVQQSKRSIFGRKERKKYNVRIHQNNNNSMQQQLQNNGIASPLSTLEMEEANIPTPSTWAMDSNSHVVTPSPLHASQQLPSFSHEVITTPPRTAIPPIEMLDYRKKLSPIAMSPITPARIPDHYYNREESHHLDIIANEFANNDEYNATTLNHTRRGNGNGQHHVNLLPNIKNYTNIKETNSTKLSSSTTLEGHYHSQAFLLSLAFFFVWTPQNLLSPNLTQSALDFGFENDNERDLYLGSYLALASSVLSLPVSAGIGIASDVVSSRRILISVTTLVGGLAAIWTSMATTYPQLILSRFINGAAMSGSVPVVFSLLSDWFDDEERNAASSGFTAMMGAGIILGQVFAGWTGPTVGWRYSFLASGTVTILLAIVTMICLREPIRGGKEKVLQKMIAQGTRYDKKLTWKQFSSSMTRNTSNFLLIIQGFFCNIPWGMMFVFLNDFLSQEKGLTVSDATFILAIFGFGCAAGGILGGYLGGLANSANRSYLPLFMALTTYLGIMPFLALINDPTYHDGSWRPCLYAFAGGCLASMPIVNIRPCIINCNPPEIRGAALTAANLVINAARGTGVSGSSKMRTLSVPIIHIYVLDCSPFHNLFLLRRHSS